MSHEAWTEHIKPFYDFYTFCKLQYCYYTIEEEIIQAYFFNFQCL